MFKNLHLLRIAPGWTADAAQAEERLAREPFQPCGATQPESAGWVPPRGTPHAPLIELVQGQWLLALMTERKMLPSSVVKDRSAEIAARLEQERGYKPGRREAKEIKEQATLELLPLAFTKRAYTRIWIDPQAGLLAIDGSATQAEGVVTLLVKALDGFAVLPLQTQQSPAGCMAAWLAEGEAPGSFFLDRECELKSPDEMRSVVRYARHALDTDEVKQHIAAGKRPTRLALSWNERVAFTLTDTLQLKKIEFLDTALEGRDGVAEDEAFDADAAIATGELRRLIPALLEALGGEQAEGQPAAASAPAAAPAPASTEAPAETADSADAAPW
ncbi:recombination-associated protein RdgC [Azohydromonas caseinilytica]|uniref:Recombination-associated protein RdgC n=1 Tax=Azohydromonas caseinilytica TaxID=2728836 RepID=A0A848FAL8_9BURK|nr:recombination-associated protein RdgC [Azohydromonas caseinilytica]NML15250.1 recombination-associated protein RdgC [Azohydromonas caseinilytica]